MTSPLTEVRFGRLERRGLLAGLSGPQLALLGVALVVLLATGMSAGPVGIAVSSPVWIGAAALALAQFAGRPLTELFPTAAPWALRRMTHRHVELRRPESATTLNVPGAVARLRVAAVPGTPAAMLQSVRSRSEAVVVARVRGRGLLLQDSAAQEQRVVSWGRVLASLGQMPHLAGVQVLHRTSSGGGAELRNWWSQQRATVASAHQLMADVVEDVALATRVDTLVAFAVRPRRDGDIGAVLNSLTDALAGAEVTVEEWLGESALRNVIRTAFDPAAKHPGPRSTGPMGVFESWSHLRSDSAFHATFWVSEWPRSGTHAGFLRALLLAPGAHRTFSLIAQPLPTGKALREIRRARAEQIADAAARARIGQVEQEVHRAAADELTRREEDLVAGHGDLRFVGLISVTASTAEKLEGACQALQTNAGQAGCDLRRLVGQQVPAFAAAALPLARIPQ